MSILETNVRGICRRWLDERRGISVSSWAAAEGREDRAGYKIASYMFISPRPGHYRLLSQYGSTELSIMLDDFCGNNVIVGRDTNSLQSHRDDH